MPQNIRRFLLMTDYLKSTCRSLAIHFLVEMDGSGSIVTDIHLRVFVICSMNAM